MPVEKQQVHLGHRVHRDHRDHCDPDNQGAESHGVAVSAANDPPSPVSTRRRRWRRPATQRCHCCNRNFPFCWRCRCGFEICQTCMDENIWGMSCNHITWQCPDCGDLNGFGNQ